MNDINWPSILGRPLQEGYSYSYGSAADIKRFIGSSRTRNNSSRYITTFNCSYLWDKDQLKRFITFCKSESGYLKYWFTQELLTGQGVVSHRVRIAEIKPFQSVVNDWKVSLSVETIDSIYMNDESAEIIIETGISNISDVETVADNLYKTIGNIHL